MVRKLRDQKETQGQRPSVCPPESGCMWLRRALGSLGTHLDHFVYQGRGIQGAIWVGWLCMGSEWAG